MRHQKCWEAEERDKHFYIDLAAWANQPNLFKYMPFAEYIRKRHPKNEDRYQYGLSVWVNS
jgi:hypothetical protein